MSSTFSSKNFCLSSEVCLSISSKASCWRITKSITSPLAISFYSSMSTLKMVPSPTTRPLWPQSSWFQLSPRLRWFRNSPNLWRRASTLWTLFVLWETKSRLSPPLGACSFVAVGRRHSGNLFRRMNQRTDSITSVWPRSGPASLARGTRLSTSIVALAIGMWGDFFQTSI